MQTLHMRLDRSQSLPALFLKVVSNLVHFGVASYVIELRYLTCLANVRWS